MTGLRVLVAAGSLLVTGCSGGPVAEPTSDPVPVVQASDAGRSPQPGPTRNARPAGAGRFQPCAEVAGDGHLCFDHDAGRARWTYDDGRTWSDGPVDLGRLMPQPAGSLAEGVFAVVGGGDGATLFPFERVVRSVDGGASWQRFELPRFGGERAYSGGQVVTSDGRLLALLDHFSDDRPGRPSDRHHGLWASAGSDWSTYRPVRVSLSPPPAPPRDGWSTIVSMGASVDPDSLIWLTTWDERLYVSTDDALTFQEIPAR